MPRTESPEEFISSASRPSTPVSDQAAVAGKWAAKLAGYGVATVAFTFMLLRPRRAASGNRGSLFLGSGVVVVLIRTLLSASEGPSASPSAAPATPVLAVATPTPAAAQPRPAARRRRPVHATVSVPGAAPVNGPGPVDPAPAVAGADVPKLNQAEAAPSAAAAASRPPSPLGPRYADKVSGYSVQFPTGWTSRPVKDGGCWVLDASDGHAAAITIGFSRFPAKMSVDEVVPGKVTRGLQKRAGTVVHGTGYSTIGGRRCLWHKYTGPVSRPGGNTRMTAVHYLLPLSNGRALEVRAAAAPERFNQIAPRMKQSLDSFKLLTPVAHSRSARAR